MSKEKRKIKRTASDLYKRIKAAGKQKHFCIGRNKTGTTSLKAAFEELGYPVGDQRKAEALAANHYFKRDFQPIINYCKSAQVFQDVPFSWPETYKHCDMAYPRSKFVLTVRDDSEQWYQSITRFHAKKFGANGRIPTADDLKASNYVSPGFMYNAVRIHGTSDESPYDKETMIAHYENYNRGVIEYFKHRPDDLLVINLAKKDAYQKFLDFFELDSPHVDFPWKNKT